VPSKIASNTTHAKRGLTQLAASPRLPPGGAM
jgi:hypothetical protein